MGVKKNGTRRAHNGIRLSKLPVGAAAAAVVSPTRPHQRQREHQQEHVVAELDPGFAYREIPDELLVGSDLDLSRWSVVAQDSCLQRLAIPQARLKISRKRKQQLSSSLSASTHALRRSSRTDSSSNGDGSSPTRSSNQLADAVLYTDRLGSPMRLQQHQQCVDIVSLNLAGAEHITDVGAIAIGNACPSLRHLNLERAVKLTDVGVRHLVSNCRQLETLNLNYIMALQSAAVSTLGELQLPLRELSLAGCVHVTDFALQRAFVGCPTLESLDVSFCAAVSDPLLLALGQHCRRLLRLKLRGCRQISDAGVVGLVNARNSSNSDLVLLDLARFDLQYKLNDIALLSLAERCRALETLVIAGCEMLTDVGISWLCAGCFALTSLDVSKCAKLTDVALRSVGEHLLQLRRLDISHCVRISDLGLRHVALGCPDLERVDAVGLALLSDPRPLDDSAVYSVGKRQYEGVAALAMHCPKLQHLHLAQCTSIGDATLQCVALKSHALTTFDVTGCVRVTHIGVHALLLHAHRLVALTVSGCDKVSDRAFDGVRLNAAAEGDALLHAIHPSDPLRHLTSLRLHGCALVSDATLQCLGALELAMRDLDISGCVRVSDIGLLALADSSTLALSLQSIKLRNLAAITETGLSWLADKCHSLLLLDVTGCSRIKAFSLQALASNWRFATYTVTDRFKGVAPKHRATDWLLIEAYGDGWRAATRIQSLYRARVARRVAQQKRDERLVLWVATRLQSVCRGRQARKLAVLRRIQFRKESDAARQIQSKFRQRHARREVAHLRVERQKQRQLNAARCIQAAWRRKQLCGRLCVRSLARDARSAQRHQAASCIQRAWRGTQARAHTRLLRVANAAQHREQHEAANKMQNVLRARAAQREVARKRQALRDDDARREHAAVRVQTHVRRRRAQRIVAARLLLAKRMHDEAASIQHWWRAKKRLFALQLVLVARQHHEEHAAAVKLQAAWKRKQGRQDAKLLRLIREQAQQHVAKAALTVQTHWRAKRARVEVAAAKQHALEKLLLEMKMQHRAAALVQAHFRGRRGRELYRDMLLRKKQRWKRVEQPESGQVFYYNKETGEVRFRCPQDMLDLMPKPLCSNCVDPATHIAQLECKECGEMYCNTCWLNVHAGGKRRWHEFRCLYDFYDRRVDYGDGEFPCKWPSEVEQDEIEGWALRMFPRRQPVDVIESWERYVDNESGREWFYNKEAETNSYNAPSVFATTSESGGSSAGADSAWTKYCDDIQGVEYYYNSRTFESTYARPNDFATARQAPLGAPVATDGTYTAPLASSRDGWEKYVDPQSGYPYYYNAQTLESTYARPLNFQTARRGSVAIEAGVNAWAKYYDLAQGVYYYYNTQTFERSFARPLEFATPRAVEHSGAAELTEFYDPATAKAYVYNMQTTECQLAAAPPASGTTARMHDYR